MSLERRTPMPRGEGPKRRTRLEPGSPLKRGTGLSRAPRPGIPPKPRPARRDTIPPRVRKTVARRDEWSCVRCGSAKDLQQHHRRIKGFGGDTRPHTECPCNIVMLCSRHHSEAHRADRALAEARGLVVPRSALLPGQVPVVLTGDAVVWLACDGTCSTVPPEEAAAA